MGGTMSSITINGDTSGSVILQAPSVAGSTTLTLPSTSGTVVTDATSTGINASALSTGTVPTARLASGTANSTTYLRGDQTWASVSSTPTTQQVLDATAGASAGAVGTYAFLFLNSSSQGYDTPFGSTRSGSLLQPSNAANQTPGTAQSGTWRTMGQAFGADGTRGVTVFLRIS